MDQQRQQVRDSMMALAPPTREEIARTIFVGRTTQGCGGDEGVERILRTAGGLRRWTRALDSEGKPCRFGFAEFEDVESLETAAEIFRNVKVRLEKPRPKVVHTENGTEKKEDTEEAGDQDEGNLDEAKMVTLLVSRQSQHLPIITKSIRLIQW